MINNIFKGVWVVFFIVLCSLVCNSCSLTPKYYSKWKVKNFTKELVADDVKYVDVEEIEGRKVFYFEDPEGRPFSIIVNSQRMQMYNAGELPFYMTEILDTYQLSIFQYEREKIQKILDDSSLGWTELSSFDATTEEIFEINVAYIIHMGINLGSPIEKNDLKEIAQVGAKIDQILRFDYDKDLDTKLNFEEQHLCGMRIVFCRDEDNHINRSVEVPFSRSDEDRWTEDSLYNYLSEEYGIYEEEMRLRAEIPEFVVMELENKYKTEFIYDEDIGTVGNPVRDDEVEVVIYEEGFVKEEYSIRVKVKMLSSDKKKFVYDVYADDYERIREYREFRE